MTITSELNVLLNKDIDKEEKGKLLVLILDNYQDGCRNINAYTATQVYETFGDILPDCFFVFMGPLAARSLIRFNHNDKRFNWDCLNYPDRVVLALDYPALAKEKIDFRNFTYLDIANFINIIDDLEFISTISFLVHDSRLSAFVLLVSEDKREHLRLNGSVKLLLKIAFTHNELLNKYFPYEEMTGEQSLKVLTSVSTLPVDVTDRLRKNTINLEPALAKRLLTSTEESFSKHILMAYIQDKRVLTHPRVIRSHTRYSVKALLLTDIETHTELPVGLLSSRDILDLISKNSKMANILDLDTIVGSELLEEYKLDPSIVKTIGADKFIEILLRDILSSPLISKQLITDVLLREELTENPLQFKI